MRRGYSPTEFHLRMTREEIGSYLGLKLETVSRLFSRFQDDGLIEVQQKHVRILDIAGLEARAEREQLAMALRLRRWWQSILPPRRWAAEEAAHRTAWGQG